MDQNQPIDNQVLDQKTDNDLQKAIDDITNTTNVDPVFSDPVAAPSSVPEGDTGELGEPVGPFPAPEPEPAPETPAPTPTVEMAPPAPEPIAPVDPIAIPNLEVPEAPAPLPEQPAPEPTQPIAPEPPAPEAPAITLNQPAENLNMHQVKEAALRDLVPLLDRLNMGPSQKFNLYRNIFEQLKDYTVLEPAYRAASEISDDTERAEALLYLVESIDKM